MDTLPQRLSTSGCNKQSNLDKEKLNLEGRTGRHRVKPIVYSTVCSEIPPNIKSLYYEFLNHSKTKCGLKYLNKENNRRVINVSKHLGKTCSDLGYPKLNVFRHKVKGIKAMLDANLNSIFPNSKSVRFNT